ncbi:MAG: YceI family protein [Gemmatimonadota bacterium]
MKPRLRYGGLLAVATAALALTGWSAIASYPFQPESRLWIDGTSTLRSFTCEAETLSGGVVPKGAAAELSLDRLGEAVGSAEAVVPVAALECGNGTMNDHMRKALKADENPQIRFALSSYEVGPMNGANRSVTLVGGLTIAGQEKPVTFHGTATQEPSGAMRVVGSTEIVMTEYGMKPPRLMLGTLRVGDRVTVNYDVVVKP